MFCEEPLVGGYGNPIISFAPKLKLKPINGLAVIASLSTLNLKIKNWGFRTKFQQNLKGNIKKHIIKCFVYGAGVENIASVARSLLFAGSPCNHLENIFFYRLGSFEL